jgi:cellobiose phosphorylase
MVDTTYRMQTIELLPHEDENTVLRKGDLAVELLPTGDVKQICRGAVLFNQFIVSARVGAVGAIYLRRYDGGKIVEVVRLNGRGSPSQFAADESGAVYSGQIGQAKYALQLLVTEDTWYYRLTLIGSGKFDALYTFDTGVGDTSFIRANELYASQYLGHTVFDTDYGFAIGSRQNLRQSSGNPALIQGAIGIRAVGYSTDGLQFFGSMYRATDTPALLYAHLPNVNHQYEMAFIALEAEAFTLDGERTFGFFGHTVLDCPHALDTPPEYARVLAAFADLPAPTAVPKPPLKLSPRFGAPLNGRPDTDADFPRDCLLPEYSADGALWSTFDARHVHTVGRRKELAVLRPHGHILLAPFDLAAVPQNVMTTTCFMYGLFQAQTAIGNTSSNALLSKPRGFLDATKSEGLRIWVETGGRFRLLRLPTLFEMGLSFARWTYKLDDDELTVVTYVSEGQAVTRLDSKIGRSYSMIVALHVAFGELPCSLTKQRRTLRFTPHPDSPTARYAPGLSYTVGLDADCTIGDDRIFFDDAQPRDRTLVTLSVTAAAFTLTVAAKQAQPIALETAEKRMSLWYDDLLRHMLFRGKDADKWNQTLYRFGHDALVHYAAPHGLEQTGGAAWGTRDVCQGPIEFFLAVGRFDTVRAILLHVFGFQSSDGTWPQWFMFDGYPYAADDCHGDVVFWPLKSLGDYLIRSNDLSILSMRVPFRTGKAATVSAHVRRALAHIETRVDTSGLVSYAGGDWDDTLQPADPAMRETLVSSWTMALAYETLAALAPYAPFGRACRTLSKRIRAGFSHLIKDGVIAGFGRKQGDELELLLHPDDMQTGIRLRLLPLTRSILAGLVDHGQARRNAEQIERRLLCPDGVRLTDAPARYAGGVSTLFARAEQAANVGREIGLMYTHAHIRYVEAMAALGDAEAAYRGLLVVNPIGIEKVVPNALPRQANAYFSSSDAAFDDRYRFARDFAAVRDGAIPVRGGWRVYSSGGGIYLARLIQDVYGLTVCESGILLDPVLPSDCDGDALDVRLFGKMHMLVYHVSNRAGVKTVSVDCGGKRVSCPYRTGGLFLARRELEYADRLDIYLT